MVAWGGLAGLSRRRPKDILAAGGGAMITNIVLDNFKGFRHVEIAPKRITAFVGPNGTGKSSVLQAFGLLKQTVEEPRLLSIRSAISHPMPLVANGSLVNLPNTGSLTANFGDDQPESTLPEMSFSGACTLSNQEDQYRCMAYFSKNDRVLLKEADVDNTRFPRFALSLRALKRLRMVPAIRGFSDPVHQLRDNPVKDVSLLNGITEQAEQTATNLCYSPEEVERISRLLKKVTGTGLRADTVPPQSVEVKSLNQAGAFNIVAEGFGTNSLIMLLLQLVTAEPEATVMIEEPEIHLHPKAQADLAEVMVEEAVAGNKQVIMTTHSETILGRLLTLVAEKRLTPEDLAIYAFEKDGETGVCSAKPLQISAGGGVEGGVRDFFDTNLAEMNRYVEAQFAQVNEKAS